MVIARACLSQNWQCICYYAKVIQRSRGVCSAVLVRGTVVALVEVNGRCGMSERDVDRGPSDGGRGRACD
jgi:hypothetical protein